MRSVAVWVRNLWKEWRTVTRERLARYVRVLGRLANRYKAGPLDRLTGLVDLLARFVAAWDEGPAGRLRHALGRLLKDWNKTCCGRLMAGAEKLFARVGESFLQWKKDRWKPTRAKLERSLGIELLEKRQLLSVFTWIGSTTSNNWSYGANWSGGSAPSAGAALVFSGTNTTTNNDVQGMSFSSVTLNGNFSLGATASR